MDLQVTSCRSSGTLSPLDVPQDYYDLLHSASERNKAWSAACLHHECTFHQLSPYIGKLKSSIASDLVKRFSRPNDVVFDPFSGSGTVPLEAALAGRRVIANDSSLYAATLTKGKLLGPRDESAAISAAEYMLSAAERRALPDLRHVPVWVRRFFDPRTLKEAIRFFEVAKEADDAFLMGCFLGILHHQRPGFLSYPSSHLVPYLRDKQFPRDRYSELYEYRELRPRLLAKVARAFKRPPNRDIAGQTISCRQEPIQQLSLRANFDSLITSPPYMNALDYGRDNRLRLWFLGEQCSSDLDRQTNGREQFHGAMKRVANLVENRLNGDGFAVFVVGERDSRGFNHFPSAEVAAIIHKYAPSMRLSEIIADDIPDVRRSRRRLSGVKKEHILVYRKDVYA